MTTRIGSLVFKDTPDARQRFAELGLDTDFEDVFKITLNGTDTNGQHVIPRFVQVDNFDNVSPVGVTINGIKNTVAPYTRTTFEIATYTPEIGIHAYEGVVKLYISETKLGIGDGTNDLAKDSAFNMGTYYNRDGSSPMIADVDMGGNGFRNLKEKALSSTIIAFKNKRSDTAVERNGRDKLSEVISVDDFGADATGATDSLPALLKAIAACPEGGTIYFPGTYRFSAPANSKPVLINKTMTFLGPSKRVGNVPDGNKATGNLYFDSNVDVAIEVANVLLSLESVTIAGIGLPASTGWGVYCHGDASAVNLFGGALIQNFKIGLNVVTADYCKIVNSTITYCQTAAQFESCYNLQIVCSHLRPDGAGSRALVLINNCQANAFGGAFESFQEYGVVLLSGSMLKCEGVYWEGNVDTHLAWNVYMSDNTSFTERDSFVYMTGCARHVSVEGSGTNNIRIISEGSTFITETSARRVDYYSFNQSKANGQVDITMARYLADTNPGPSNNWLNPDYTGGYPAVAQGVGRYLIEYPFGHPNFGKSVDNRFIGINAVVAPAGGSVIDVQARQAISGVLTVLKANNG